LRASPVSDTIAKDKPKLKASLSIALIEYLSGKRADIRLYPGENNKNINPRIIRAAPSVYITRGTSAADKTDVITRSIMLNYC